MKKLIAVFAATLMTLAIAAPAMAQSEARIHLIHGIPDTPVDVIVDGEAVFTDFNFGDTQDLSSLAGATLTGLTRSWSQAPILLRLVRLTSMFRLRATTR